jgi:hypothetical protein
MSKRRPGSGVLFARYADSRSAGRRFHTEPVLTTNGVLNAAAQRIRARRLPGMRPAEFALSLFPPRSATERPTRYFSAGSGARLTPSLDEFGQRGRDLEVLRHRGVGTRPGVQIGIVAAGSLTATRSRSSVNGADRDL